MVMVMAALLSDETQHLANGSFECLIMIIVLFGNSVISSGNCTSKISYGFISP